MSGERPGPWVGVLPIPLVMPFVLLFTLSALFAETRVGKVRAKSLEGDLRSHWKCRHIYSLLADAATVAVFMVYSLLSWLTQGIQP